MQTDSKNLLFQRQDHTDTLRRVDVVRLAFQHRSVSIRRQVEQRRIRWVGQGARRHTDSCLQCGRVQLRRLRVAFDAGVGVNQLQVGGLRGRGCC